MGAIATEEKDKSVPRRRYEQYELDSPDFISRKEKSLGRKVITPVRIDSPEPEEQKL